MSESNSLDDLVRQQLSASPGCITPRSLAHLRNISQGEAAGLLEEWWKKHGSDQVHSYYCVLAKDHEDAFVTVIRHSSEIDAWITGNVKELEWKGIYGLASSRLLDINTLVTFNRSFPLRATSPIVDVPVTKPVRMITSTSSQGKKEAKPVPERSAKKELEQVPDFGTDLPEGVTAANFHQNLFKPISGASKRKKTAKSQTTKSQAVGISAIFKSKSPPEHSPTKDDSNTPPAPVSPKEKVGVAMEEVLHMDFSTEDELMPGVPDDSTDVKMAEPEDKAKDHPQGMSKYLVIESTTPHEAVGSKSFSRRARKPTPALS